MYVETFNCLQSRGKFRSSESLAFFSREWRSRVSLLAVICSLWCYWLFGLDCCMYFGWVNLFSSTHAVTSAIMPYWISLGILIEYSLNNQWMLVERVNPIALCHFLTWVRRPENELVILLYFFCWCWTWNWRMYT